MKPDNEWMLQISKMTGLEQLSIENCAKGWHLTSKPILKIKVIL